MELARPLVPPCAVITNLGKCMWAVAKVDGGEMYYYNERNYLMPVSGVICTDEPGTSTLNDAVVIDERELLMIDRYEQGSGVMDAAVIRKYTWRSNREQ